MASNPTYQETGSDLIAAAQRAASSVIIALLISHPTGAAAAESTTADLVIKQQTEADWGDPRWSQTDLGNFHASIVALPNSSIAKGLSVRLGEKGEAAVVYDTASLTLHAGWTGGFLKFNGARYGLIQAPQPDGELRFVASPSPAWGMNEVKWRGLHVQGPRVVLDYEVGGVGVKESPWHEAAAGVAAFTRVLEVGGRSQALTLSLLDGKGHDFATRQIDGVTVATRAAPNGLIAVATQGDTAMLRWSDEVLQLELPSAGPSRIKVFISNCAAEDLPRFAALVKQSPLVGGRAALATAGPTRWHSLTTRGQPGVGNDAYLIDTLTVPYENPWKALFFTSGVDFLPNGDAAVCTLHGDVWLVSGIDSQLDRLTWRRFATGLFQPLGLRVRNGKVFVLGRDQITRLHDENGDGEADFYENFFNGIRTSTGGHDFVTSLELDAQGNFYFVDPNGLHRLLADGSKLETLASGWRNPNGMGASPDGRILTVAPQQGQWTPSSAIAEAQPGGWYGYGGPKVTPERPLGFDPPLCWIPHSVDNSGGSQLWVTSERWGPLAGQLLHFSFGRCAHFLVLREVVDGTAQGALVPLPGRFLSGAMRGAFNPLDGQLYVVGARGWQTSATQDGCLQRVRYTGRDPLVPIAYHAHRNGLRLTFTAKLDRVTAEDAGSYAMTQWNYRYAAQYGSKDYSVLDPNQEGRDPVEIRSAKLLPDGKTVFLEIPTLGPVMQWDLQYSLDTTDGKALRSRLHGTINKLAEAFRP